MEAETFVIGARNVNDALSAGLKLLKKVGIEEKSRNGPVLVAPGPVVTEYARPWERVLFHPARDANPFFHLLEAAWMLAGRNDLALPAKLLPRFSEYSDNGETLHGAYGHRWRHWFAVDQVERSIERLRQEPESRRVAISMWDAGTDIHYYGRDLPCNTHIYFDLRGGKLNMTVCCRSNDVLWGAYGANAVHFSVLQEYMATALGAPMGRYRQLSNNFHLYTNVLDPDSEKGQELINRVYDHYPTGEVPPDRRLFGGKEELEILVPELELFLNDVTNGRVSTNCWESYFIDRVLEPVYLSWLSYKNSNFAAAMGWAVGINAPDWSLACVEWLQRRSGGVK